MASRLGKVLFFFFSLIGLGVALLYLCFGTLGPTGDVMAGAAGFGIPFLFGCACLFVLSGGRG